MGALAKRGRIGVILAVLLLCCFPAVSLDADGKIVVVTSLFPQYDFVREIGGDLVTARMLLPPGVEAHSYEPSPQDLVAISQADLFIYTGPVMEPWADRIIQAIRGEGNVRVVDASQGIVILDAEELVDANPGLGHDGEDAHDEMPQAQNTHADSGHSGHSGHSEEEGEKEAFSHEFQHERHSHGAGPDPHFWLDPSLAAVMVDTIAAALKQAAPDKAGAFEAARRRYRAQLEQLDAAFHKTVAAAPRRELFFGGRFAFGYFFRAYGLREVGPFRYCAPGGEPGLAIVLKVIHKAREDRVRFIYTETTDVGRIAKIITEETGAAILSVDSLHNPTRQQRADGISYLSGMRGNMDAFAKGLQ